jgi:hypothetical protein
MTYSLIKKISLSKEFSMRTLIESTGNPTGGFGLDITGVSMKMLSSKISLLN